MTSHKDHQLDQLGINSQYEADELERELDIRFDRFSYHGREAWVQQNAYLDAYANTRAVSNAADTAGVTVPTAQAWKFLNTLGFKRRLEIADLRFSDSLQVMALERAREPDAPASLLIALLRAHIPEKFSSNGHTCDTSKADELLFLYSQDAKRELDAGHPTFRAIANGTYQPPNRHTGGGGNPEAAHSNLSPAGGEIQRGGSFPENQYDSQETTLPHDDISPDEPDTPTRHSRERGNPEAAHSNLSPAGEDTPRSNLSPAGGEIQRGGSFPENQYDSQETTPHDDIHPVDPDEIARANLSPSPEEHTSSPSPVVGESLPRTRYGGWGEGEGEMPRPQNPAPSTQNPSAPSAPSAVNPSPTPQNPAPSTQNPSASSAPSAVNPSPTPQNPAPSTQNPSASSALSAVNPSPTPQNPAPSTQNPSASSALSAVNPSPTPQNPAPSTQNPSASSAVKPTRRPIASIFQTRRPSQNDDPNTFKVTRF